MSKQVQFVMRKGEKYVRLAAFYGRTATLEEYRSYGIPVPKNATPGQEYGLMHRQPGKWVATFGSAPKDGAKKTVKNASHAATKTMLMAEATALAAQGYVGELDPSFELDDDSFDLVLAYGGNLAAPPMDMHLNKRAPIFRVCRTIDEKLSAAEDHALHRLAAAVGLTARDETSGETVLHVAARCASVSLAEVCLAAGVSADAVDVAEQTPRSLATGLAQKNPARKKILALFDAAAAPPKRTVRELEIAARQGDVAEVERCLADGAPITAKVLVAAAGAAVTSGDQVLEIFFASGARPHGGELEAVLFAAHDAPALDFTARMQRLVNMGAREPADQVIEWLGNTNYPASLRRTLAHSLREIGALALPIPLAAAVTMRDVAAVRDALAAGADANTTVDFFPLLHLAACDGGQYSSGRKTFYSTLPASAEIVELLLAKGADPDARAPQLSAALDGPDYAVDGFFNLHGTRADHAPQKALRAKGITADKKLELQRIVKAIQSAREQRK